MRENSFIVFILRHFLEFIEEQTLLKFQVIPISFTEVKW